MSFTVEPLIAEFRMGQIELEAEILRERLRNLPIVAITETDENQKLRELVRDMWQGMCKSNRPCYECEHYVNDGCEFRIRMRELGIEVDE